MSQPLLCREFEFLSDVAFERETLDTSGAPNSRG
jgi:hypothetical protein